MTIATVLAVEMIKPLPSGPGLNIQPWEFLIIIPLVIALIVVSFVIDAQRRETLRKKYPWKSAYQKRRWPF